MHYFEYSYAAEDGLNGLAVLLSGFPFMALTIGAYVLTALALYTLAKERGIRHGWLAWIPLARCWLFGSLSDQYRYLVRGQIKNKRKVLLILKILNSVLILTFVVLAVAALIAGRRVSAMSYSFAQQEALGQLIGLGIVLVCVALVTAGVVIAATVLRFMALGDIYRSMDPENGSLFLVLSILFPVTEAFFLFFNRNKELGMPPRREAARQETQWEQIGFEDF